MPAIEGLSFMSSFARYESPPRGRSSLRNPFRLWISREAWLALVFMLLSFALGIFWFVVLVSLLATGIGLAITLIGLPLLIATLVLWTYGARLERARVDALLGVHIENPYRPTPDLPFVNRLISRITDPHSWLDLLYLFLLFPIGIAEFVITTISISLTVGTLGLPIAYWFHGSGDAWFVFFNHSVTNFPEAVALSLLGIPMLIALPYVFIGVGRGHAWFARALLGVNREAQLNLRVGQLSESRSRALDAALTDLQRIERDLHDGAQQRLVKLSMDLGMAREKIKTDPAAAESLVAEAHEEAKRAMAEIRDLARGILPAVLTDRGLDAAISALAGRSPIPVTVDVCLSERPSVTVETTAYFVVAEALTNIARHSKASEAHVVIKRENGLLEVDVVDDGIGGADVTTGTGLNGLRDRLAAVDGTLNVTSPSGGPTRLHAEIPCV